MLAGDGETNVSFLWTSLDGVTGGKALPAPVVGLCRKVVDQLVFGGDPFKDSFTIEYGGCTYECRVREDQVGGYKILVLSKCGCVDRRSFLLLFDGDPDPNTYYASRPTGLVELINPTAGTPRPDPDPATFTKGYRVPPELRIPPEGVDPARAPGGYLRTSSMHSGQMRMIAGCYHLSGLNSPFGYTYAKTHGVVEYPRPRAADINGKFPPGRKFWIVEASPLGVFAMPIKYSGVCCDLQAQVSRAMPTDAEIAITPELEAFRTELDLAWAFTAKPAAGITQLISDTDMAAVYAKGSPQALAHGWAFSYSGHEASNVVFTPHNSPDNYWEIWHPRLTFTTGNPMPGVYTISAAIDYLTSDFKLHNNVSTLVWFQSEAFPGFYEQFFPYSFNGGTTVSVDYADAPIYVFYQGDERRVLTMSSSQEASGGFGAWSDPTQAACSPLWICDGTTTRVRNDTAVINGTLAFGDGFVSVVVGSQTRESATSSDNGLDYFQASGNSLNTDPFNCPCNGAPAWEGDFSEWWKSTQSTYNESAAYGGAVCAILSHGDRESLFLGQRNDTNGSFSSSTRSWQILMALVRACYSDDPGVTENTQYPTLEDTGPYICFDYPGINQHGNCCVGQVSPTTDPVGDSGSISDSVQQGVAFIGSNEFLLASDAEISDFFTAINPALADPIYPPGPVGVHGNMQYNEPSLVKEAVTNPLIDYVFTDGTNGWMASGGFSFTKPPSGPALVPPLAFVGRV